MVETNEQFNVEKLARLARLELSSDELTTYGRQLNGVLKYIDEIANIPLVGLSQDVNRIAPHHNLINITREDVVSDNSVDMNAMLNNAPMTEGTAIKVHAVLGASDE